MAGLISGGRRLAGVVLGFSIVAVGAAGCGNPSFDKGFNDKWSKTTHDSCVSARVSQGGAADEANRYCTCVVDKLMPLTVAQKMGLNGSSPELQQAANACLAQEQTPAGNSTTPAPAGGAPLTNSAGAETTTP
jgi:hypothetical protein